MEPVFERLKLSESARQKLRPLLTGITPSMLADMDQDASFDKLQQLGVEKIMSIGLAAGSIGYLKSILTISVYCHFIII